MAVPFRASRHLSSIIGYCVLVTLVLLGLAAMHSGASAVMAAGSHSTQHSVSMAPANPAPPSAHEADAREPHATATGSATLSAVGSATSSIGHGLMAGCVLALTGAIGLVLARLLARSADGPAWRVVSTREGWRTIGVPGLAAPPPRARFSLCVLRT